MQEVFSNRSFVLTTILRNGFRNTVKGATSETDVIDIRFSKIFGIHINHWKQVDTLWMETLQFSPEHVVIAIFSQINWYVVP